MDNFSLNRILVPLGGSPFAEVVLPLLTRLARRLGASLTLLHIVDNGALRGRPDPVLLPLIQRAIEDANSAGAAYLEGVRERLAGEGVDVETATAIGSPVPVIVSLARERGAGLIALSRRSVPRPETAAIGTVASQVLHTAPLPLLIFPARDGAAPPLADTSKVLVPLDGSPEGEHGLRTALPLARSLGASLALLRVLPDLRIGLYDLRAPGLRAESNEQWRAAEGHALEYLERHRPAAAAEGVATELALARGDASAQIVEAAAADPGAIIVMSTYTRSGPRSYALGSVTARVVRDARNPVLVVPREPNTPRVML